MKRKVFVGTGVVPAGLLKTRKRTSIIAAPDRDAAVVYWLGMDFHPNEIREIDLDEDGPYPVIPLVRKIDEEMK